MTSRDDLVRRLPRIRTLIECCVTLGCQALDTAGNARETADWVRENHIRSLIVVTSNYHMPRALAEIGRTLSDVEIMTYSVVPERAKAMRWWTEAPRLRLVVVEYLKYVAVLANRTFSGRAVHPTSPVVATESL